MTLANFLFYFLNPPTRSPSAHPEHDVPRDVRLVDGGAIHFRPQQRPFVVHLSSLLPALCEVVVRIQYAG